MSLSLQLSTVIRFLESINDYMRFKDEELALSISAQRVESYEVEGINEEIDKVEAVSLTSHVYFSDGLTEAVLFCST